MDPKSPEREIEVVPITEPVPKREPVPTPQPTPEPSPEKAPEKAPANWEGVRVCLPIPHGYIL